jgi:3-hydroxyacyl-[acyl-carrier protein] dehydratase/trans-2-decenoyl-[acyl-carrier protein] isomerase
MKYEEFLERSAFTQDELLAFAAGALVLDAPPLFAARLPLPPMLMIDRIIDIRTRGSRGAVVAERAVSAGDWFFECHFAGDPVQPGCLGVDAVWQMLGFYCAWRGGLGAGRALGCGAVAFDGQIRPDDRMVRYEVEIRRCTGLAGGAATLAIADAVVLVDERPVYTLKDARVGLFPELARENEAARNAAQNVFCAIPPDAGVMPGIESRRGDVPIGRTWAEATL